MVACCRCRCSTSWMQTSRFRTEWMICSSTWSRRRRCRDGPQPPTGATRWHPNSMFRWPFVIAPLSMFYRRSNFTHYEELLTQQSHDAGRHTRSLGGVEQHQCMEAGFRGSDGGLRRCRQSLSSRAGKRAGSRPPLTSTSVQSTRTALVRVAEAICTGGNSRLERRSLSCLPCALADASRLMHNRYRVCEKPHRHAG